MFVLNRDVEAPDALSTEQENTYLIYLILQVRRRETQSCKRTPSQKSDLQNTLIWAAGTGLKKGTWSKSLNPKERESKNVSQYQLWLVNQRTGL